MSDGDDGCALVGFGCLVVPFAVIFVFVSTYIVMFNASPSNDVSFSAAAIGTVITFFAIGAVVRVVLTRDKNQQKRGEALAAAAAKEAATVAAKQAERAAFVDRFHSLYRDIDRYVSSTVALESHCLSLAREIEEVVAAAKRDLYLQAGNTFWDNVENSAYAMDRFAKNQRKMHDAAEGYRRATESLLNDYPEVDHKFRSFPLIASSELGTRMQHLASEIGDLSYKADTVPHMSIVKAQNRTTAAVQSLDRSMARMASHISGAVRQSTAANQIVQGELANRLRAQHYEQIAVARQIHDTSREIANDVWWIRHR